MFAKTATATNTGQPTSAKKSATLRTIALAGVMAIAASACSLSPSTETATPKGTTTTTINTEAPVDETDEAAAPGSDDTESPVVQPRATPNPAPAPENNGQTQNTAPPLPPQTTPPPPAAAPSYTIGACDFLDRPEHPQYQLFADTETRVEPVDGQILDVIYVGDVVYPFFDSIDCAIGDDGTAWWLVSLDNSDDIAWINSGWLDPFGVDTTPVATSYADLDLYLVGAECFEQNVTAACDEITSRNDGTAAQIGSTFVNAYMAGDVATLDSLSINYLVGNWFDLAATTDEPGDGFGIESLQVSGNTISFVPFPTGSTSCYVENSVVAYCTYGE